MKLTPQDAQAIDLLLDGALTATRSAEAGGAMFASAASHAGVSNTQVSAVEKVLGLLDALPSPDPAGDLLRRTLERIDASVDAPFRGHAATLVDAGRPIA